MHSDRSYRLFLREVSPGEYQDFRQSAVDSRKKLRSRIAHVTVKTQGIAPNDVLKFGAGELSQAVLGEAMPANPGELQIAIERRGQIVASKTIVLAEGDSALVELIAPPLVAGLPKVETRAPPPKKELPPPPVESVKTEPKSKEGGGILTSPIFWTVVGGLVAAGAGVGIYYGVRPQSGFDAGLGTIDVDAR